nr:MAG TPA: RNA polymerase sigma factor [Caudoviricetes sp.]
MSRVKIVLTAEQQQLAADNIKLAYWYANKAVKQPAIVAIGMDIDDCISTALEALCTAAAKYDPTCGTKFSTFYHIHAWSVFRREIVTANRLSRRESTNTVSLSIPVCCDGGQIVTLADAIPAKQPDVLEMIADAEITEQILRAASEQPEKWRDAFTACILDGRGYTSYSRENKRIGTPQNARICALKAAKAVYAQMVAGNVL